MMISFSHTFITIKTFKKSFEQKKLEESYSVTILNCEKTASMLDRRPVKTVFLGCCHTNKNVIKQYLNGPSLLNCLRDDY